MNRNLIIIILILGILGSIFLYQVVQEAKNFDFDSVFQSAEKINLNQAIKNENLNVLPADEEYEDIGELNYFTLELGRSDADIMSKRTYTFYLPVDLVYELQGVDASSSLLIFKKADREIFKLTNFDYLRTAAEIDEFWPNYDQYSFVGDHTNILEIEDDDYEAEMYIFADTLKIDDELAF